MFQCFRRLKLVAIRYCHTYITDGAKTIHKVSAKLWPAVSSSNVALYLTNVTCVSCKF